MSGQDSSSSGIKIAIIEFVHFTETISKRCKWKGVQIFPNTITALQEIHSTVDCIIVATGRGDIKSFVKALRAKDFSQPVIVWGEGNSHEDVDGLVFQRSSADGVLECIFKQCLNIEFSRS